MEPQDCDNCVDPGLDDVLDVLSSWRRRFVVYHLEETEDDLAGVDDLATAIVDREPPSVEGGKVDAVLHHNTLPRLRDAGVVEYDERSGAVRYQPDAIPDPLLESLRTVEQEE